MSVDVIKVDQTKLAVERTFLAYERTLMAWVRTSTSLITFGFTLYKFFYFLKDVDPTKHVSQVLSARTYGLIMITIGVVSLIGATFQHRSYIKHLRRDYPGLPFSQATLLATLIAILGALSFVVTIFRL